MTLDEMKILADQLNDPTTQNVGKLDRLYREQNEALDAGDTTTAAIIQNRIDLLIKDTHE